MKRVLMMCRADPSEFVRRATVNFISDWLCSGPVLCSGSMLIDCLVAVSDAGSRDVDCDVKCAAVRFWGRYLSEDISQSKISPCCRMAVVCGGVGCLVSAVSDFDRAVRLDSLRTLVNVRQLVEADLLLLEHSTPARSRGSTCSDQICVNGDFLKASLQRVNRDFLEHSLRRVPPNSDCDRPPSSHETGCDLAVNSGDVDRLGSFATVLPRLRDSLQMTDWASLLASESQLTGDCHVDNPTSLLDDILETARHQSDLSTDRNGYVDSSESQDVMIADCY